MTALPPVGLGAWAAEASGSRDALLAGAFEGAIATSATHGTYISVGEHRAEELVGELAGVPFAVKDNIDVAGFATTAGSPVFAGSRPDVDAGVVSALRSEGAVVVGKTNMHELAFGITSNNAHYGPVRNPVDPSRSAGGSSGGSAATVALGTVPFSLGTDTGGSITVPASFCGVVGFRPSAGRYPSDGLVGLSWTRDTVGIHARSVGDARLVDRVITRSPRAAARAPGDLVIGVPRRRYEDVDPEVAEVAERALRTLAASGVRLVDVDIADDLEIGGGPGLELVLFESERLLVARAAADGIPADFASLAESVASPDVKGLAGMIAASPFPAAAYDAARAARWGLRRSYSELFASGIDAIVAPSCAVLPPAVGNDGTVELNGREVPVFATVTRNTAPGTVAGVPMLTLPAGAGESGLPVGMTFEGAFFEDDALLALGELVEGLGLATV